MAPGGQDSRVGFIHTNNYNVLDFAIFDQLNYSFDSNVDIFNWHQLHTFNGFDPEPDDFVLSFEDQQIHISFDRNGNIHSDSEAIIECNIVPRTHTCKEIDSWQVTLTDGRMLYFEQKEYTRQRQPDSYYNVVNSWYLTKIVDANLNDEILFKYNTIYANEYNANQLYYSPETYTNIFAQLQSSCSSTSPNHTHYTHLGNSNLVYFVYSVYLEEIENSREKILFEIGNSGHYGMNKQLKKIEIFCKINNQIEKTYSFDYLTYKTDHNPNRFLLHKITEYKDNPLSTAKPPYIFEYHNEIEIPFFWPIVNGPTGSEAGVDHWGFYNGPKEPYKTFIPEITIPLGSHSITGIDRTPNINFAIAGALKKIIYPTGGYNTIEYELHDYSFIRNHYVLNYKNPGGGIRVKRTTFNDNDITDYIYETVANNNLISSGVIEFEPSYVHSYNHIADVYFPNFQMYIWRGSELV